MLAPLLVWWLGATQPQLDERRLLDAWAAARGVHASVVPSGGEPQYDSGAVEQIEAALENARAEAAPDELARAERLLLAHPELPQAAWLLAERHALSAHEGEGEGPSTALDQALALEGARAPAAGGAAAPSTVAARGDGLPLAALSFPRMRPGDEVFIDGLPLQEHELSPGRHHVRVLRGGRLAWAGWPVAASEPEPRPADPTRACGGLDFAGVEAGPEAPRPPPGILCPRWAAVRPNALGGIDVSSCNASSCATWQHLGAGPDPAAPLAEAHAWPGWLTWALVGAGAAATTTLVLWQAGAFERAAPTQEFVFTGPSAAAFRF